MTLTTAAWVVLSVCFLCAIIVFADLLQNPQKMRIMNVVWPLTMLYAGPLGLVGYYMIGRMHRSEHADQSGAKPKPMWQSVLLGALHCGSGCTLGDLVAAAVLLAVPFSLFGSKLAADWVVEYIFAFAMGIVFQYEAIKPMKKLPAKEVLIAALKADTLSLSFWQIGMYGWMAIADFVIFHHVLKASAPVFWLMMQVGMLCGLAVGYPVNWWLITKGIKEKM
jgi:hypothetical protein